MDRWIPIESNPEVFNSWVNAAGLVKSEAQFSDIYGLDSELLAMVPQPVHAVILLFPLTKEMEEKRRGEEAKFASDTPPPVDPGVIYIKQTIGNACGTMGMLHAVLNSGVPLVPDSALAKFHSECKGKTPEERATLLETTPLFANIHASAAASGQTAVPDNLDTELHFTSFVQRPGLNSMRLIELDGDMPAGPVDRGECTDLLEGVAKFVKDYYVSQSSSVEFSMMALGRP
ncbi:cysteine proteinase [Athelia psychrophila]|uniref:Ubiquitin carboxyl-terminal hydrolase n=1 Tax=Athelia psychrophila TaxID=1759441 RepID=A0A166CXV1_9AGAM|nr:cysteine proteinase [Fibularhizoctonia sp. CBS 109695]